METEPRVKTAIEYLDKIGTYSPTTATSVGLSFRLSGIPPQA